jgi:Flp pilus assembly protein CpaB
VAAVLVAGAVAFSLETLAPPEPESAQLVVAADDLAGGRRLDGSALRLVHWPAALVPPGAVRTIEEAAGRTLAGALGRGEPLTTLRLVGPGLADTLAQEGRVATPVRLADAGAARLLRPGDRIDLVAASAGSADPLDPVSGDPADARVVAESAGVLAVPTGDGDSSLLSGAPSSGGALLVVAVTREEALALAQAAVLGPLSVILVG